MKESDEFLVLQKYFKNLGSQYNDSSSILIGPGDDAGLFFSKNTDLIFSTDVSVSDIHFPKDLAPDLIAYRSCSVAASDIPACGGTLKWLSISLVTSSKEISWLREFAKGVRLFTRTYQVPIIGGDLVKGKECSVSVGVCGEVNSDQFLPRNGAKEGDSIYVSGTLGAAKLGLKVIKSKKKNLNSVEKKYRNKFLKPKIQTELGKNLRGIANSCIDISDGLIGDLGHICQQSKLGARIYVDSTPHEGSFKDALTWGDDYELCFTVPKNKETKLDGILKRLKIKKFKIGEITRGNGIKIFQGAKEIYLNRKSYNHLNHE
jgi:thiamine-monophosphate kinase